MTANGRLPQANFLMSRTANTGHLWVLSEYFKLASDYCRLREPMLSKLKQLSKSRASIELELVS